MYRFAVLPYANAAPLVHFIPQVCPGAKLIYNTPNNTLLELISGRVDAAIIPVVDYFGANSLEMAEGLGICADGNVESVLLQCECSLKEVRVIKLDSASKTSNLLVKVLLERHFNLRQDVKFSERTGNADACVMIGDRALCAKRSFESYDLGGEWQKLTNLPFVFAVWAYRAGHPDKEKLTEILHTAKEAGCGAVVELSRIYAERLRISEHRCRRYLTSSIHYDVGLREEAGMELFREFSTAFINEPKQPARIILTENTRNVPHAQTNKQVV